VLQSSYDLDTTSAHQLVIDAQLNALGVNWWRSNVDRAPELCCRTCYDQRLLPLQQTSWHQKKSAAPTLQLLVLKTCW